MPGRIHRFFLATLACSALALTAGAQSGTKSPTAGTGLSAKKAVELAETGHCPEALPQLRKSAPLTTDKELKLKAGLATVRCGMALNQTDTAVSALVWLNREFPSDPDVLYVTTHAYSDLSTRAALRLAGVAPQSAQAHELNAESLELQGKWDDAAKEYEAILAQDPNLSGIHYRLGRLILSKPGPGTGEVADAAKKEFEEELKIDPKNAGAEYVLGELARQAQQWDDAIDHFSKAVKLDASFAEAFLGLGFSLNSAGRYAEAIAPLERAARLQPANPTGHFQLTIAYGRTGRKQDAEREMTIFQQTSDKALKEMHGEAGQNKQLPANPQ